MIEGPNQLKDVEYPKCASSCYLYRCFLEEQINERYQTCTYYCSHKFSEENNSKVYCNECKYLYHNFYCRYPDNYSKLGNWHDRYTKFGVKEPSEINKDNNCKWFEKKEE